MSTPSVRLGVACLATGLLLTAGCQFPQLNPPASPAAPSPSPSAPDLTRPQAAAAMVRQLVARAGSRRLIQVEIAKDRASVSVLKDGKPETWAWRDQQIKQVTSDIMNVDQRSFTIDAFNIADVGALFRQAAVIAESDQDQELQIVDSSAGEVMMTVSTNPESRTVFFYPDGRLLPILDYETQAGVAAGLKDAVGSIGQALAIGVKSDLGAYLDCRGTSEKTVIRRLRASAVPTTITERAERLDVTPFAPSQVSASAVWKVVAAARTSGKLAADQAWSVTIDDRDHTGTPLMRFSFGVNQVITDLTGAPVPEQ